MDLDELRRQLDEAEASLQAKLAKVSVSADLGGDRPVFKIPLVGVRKAEITVNNGDHDLTFGLKAYRRDKDKKKDPEFFFMDVRNPGARFGASPVAIIECIYPTEAEKAEAVSELEDAKTDRDVAQAEAFLGAIKAGDSDAADDILGDEDEEDDEDEVHFLPEYRFKLSNRHNRVTDKAVLYAAHLVFLHLSGTKFQTEKWVDCLLIEREPTDRYEFQPVTSCMYCGRKLVKPSSIDDGFGPICAGRLARRYDTRVVQWKRPDA